MGSIDTTQITCTSGKRLLGAAIITIALLGASSCSSDSKSSAATRLEPSAANVPEAQPAPVTTAAASAATTAGTAATMTADTTAVADAAGGLAPTGALAQAPGTSAAGVALGSASPFGTALAITAAVSLQVDDVRKAVNDLPDLVAANGGAIFDSEVAVGDPATATAMLTVKIPPTGLEPLISGLGGIGELTGRTQQTEDVADQLADVQNRIAAAQASVDRVRLLLSTATDLDAIIRIEGELTIRETALEQLLATERNVSDRVQLATLTINITPTPPPPPVLVTAKPKLVDTGTEVKPSDSVGRALSSGWHGFVTVLHGIAVGVAFMLPVLGLLIVGGLVTLAARRLRRRRSSPVVAKIATPD